MVTFFIHLTRHWETKYVTWPVLLFISETIIHCQPFRPEPCKGQQDNCLSITIYIGYMASRHPLLNFYLIQWNIHNRSRDPCYRWNCYGLYCGQVWRRFGESLKSYGCFQILCKLGFKPCLNMLERQKPTQRIRCFFLKVYLIFRLAKRAAPRGPGKEEVLTYHVTCRSPLECCGFKIPLLIFGCKVRRNR